MIASRAMSGGGPSSSVATLARASPLRVFFFDLLHVDGRDLLDVPLAERLADDGSSCCRPRSSVPRRIVRPATSEVAETFADAVAGGYEGVVVKNLAAPYAAGRRDSAWIKVKPRHTFDLVVTAVEWGHGRRQGWLSNLHLAARDPATGELVMLGKTFKGLTDELLTWQTAHFLELEVRRTPARGPRRADHRGRDRLRRAADLHPLSRRGGAAVRPGAALPDRQDGRPRPTPSTPSARWPR